MEKRLTIHEGSSQHSTLVNALRVAADRFLENTKTMQQVADTGGNGFISATAAKALSDDFSRQRQETLDLMEYFDNILMPVTVIAEIEEEDED